MAVTVEPEFLMKVLAVAYSYRAQGKSEGLVAYNLCNALRNMGHEVTVLTRDECAEDNVINFGGSTYLKRSAGIGKAHKADYYPFARKCFQFAKQNLSDFDILHHVSPISLRYHNPLSRLDRPFIWGPVGGSIPYPPGFTRIQRREASVQRLRALDYWRLRLDPLLVRTMQSSEFIVTTSNAARSLIPRKYGQKTVVVPEGIVTDEIDSNQAIAKNYIFASGRLVPYKAFDLLIKAFSRTDACNDMELWITGSGPDRQYLADIAEASGKPDQIRLLGKVDRTENLQLMKDSLFCVFPALNEAFGGVNLESMASGKTLIVTDWGGPADLIEDGIDGYKITPESEDQYINDLRERIDYLVGHPAERIRLEQGARSKIRRFLWPNIALDYDGLYRACSK